MYDLQFFWQLINSFLVKCGWFRLQEIFDSLTDLLRIEDFSIQKVLQKTETITVCWGKRVKWILTT